MPGLVDEVRVGGDREHLDAELLQLVVVVGQIAQLGGAHEGEVARVEEEDGPLAGHVGLGDVDELTVPVGVLLEGEDLGVDQTHQ